MRPLDAPWTSCRPGDITMKHRSIVIVAALMILPSIAGALTPPAPVEDAADLVLGGASAETSHIDFEIRCRHGDTEIGAEELFVRWGYGSDLHTEGNEYDSGCTTVATLSDTKDTNIGSATVSLFEEDCCFNDVLDVGPTGTCSATVTFNYGGGTFSVNGGSAITKGGTWAVSSGPGEACGSTAGTVEFRFNW